MGGLLVHVIQKTHLVEEHRNDLIRFLTLEIPGRYCRVLPHQHREIPPTTKSQMDFEILTDHIKKWLYSRMAART